MTTTSVRREQITASLQDKEYRDLFVGQEIETGVPFQIRAMRQARGWSQRDLAERTGMTQEGVSRVENPNYGKLTLTTLKRLASAFDVALAVRFAPFSQLVEWAANLSLEDLAVPDYAHDSGLFPGAIPVGTMQTTTTQPVSQWEIGALDEGRVSRVAVPISRPLASGTAGQGEYRSESISDYTIERLEA